MKRTIYHFILGLALLCTCELVIAEEVVEAQPPPIESEVLVFVDVSGSMKQNDPLNMRAPAIRMLAGMAPENARVGIYIFGTTVRELVAFERVHDRWKLSAETASQRYQSRDMYTNIEAALLQAQKTWMTSESGSRSIILLTDGIVDIDKNAVVSEASRKRILQNVLPELQSSQTTIHTIALSENADHELLQALAQGSEGVYQKVDSAEMLQRTFMGLFEQAAPQDTVPLEGNQFVVDSSISELTLLVFHKPDSEPTRVQTPGGLLYDSKTVVDGLRWKQDTGYDLISIEKPEPGSWQILADEDPDNRAMIVTDLKLKTNELPALMLQGEAFSFQAWLEESGNIISKPDFLQLVNISMSFGDENAETSPIEIAPADETGTFTHEFDGNWQTGEMELVLNLDGKTFVREKRFPLRVFQSPVMVNWEQKPSDELTQAQTRPVMQGNILDPEMNFESETGWRITVQVIEELITVENANLLVEVLSQNGEPQAVDVVKNEQGWSFDFIPVNLGKNSIHLTLEAISPSGRQIQIKEPVIELGQEHVPAPVVEQQEQSSDLNFNNVMIPVVIGNVIFMILFVVWKLISRMRRESYLHPEEVL